MTTSKPTPPPPSSRRPQAVRKPPAASAPPSRWVALTRLSGVPRTLGIAAMLALVALFLQWLLWLRDAGGGVDEFVGPPRSDYELRDFTLTTLDAKGEFSFAVKSPRLARHPFLGTLTIDAPQFVIRDGNGTDWDATSRQAWVRKDARELRLIDDVKVDRRVTAKTTPLSLRSATLSGLLDENRLFTDDAVTITQPGSILNGTGLEADLKNNRFILKNQVRGRYERKKKP